MTRVPTLDDAESLTNWALDVEESFTELRIAQEQTAIAVADIAGKLERHMERHNVLCMEVHDFRQEFTRLEEFVHDTNEKICGMFAKRDVQLRGLQELKDRFGLC